MTSEPIDFVIPWVDGADPAWRAERTYWSDREPCEPSLAKWNDGEQRYRDNGLLRYWFRGVEKFAPWVNRIHFVTWGHLPSWLNTAHPKLHIVRHTDYIPEKWLPTFSSHCIELNIHRIKGLAEQFVYFNDDTYLVAPVSPKDFFRKGLPCDAAIISPIQLRQNGIRAEINDLYVINANFRKSKVLSSHPFKWFSPCYGLSLVRTLTQLPYSLFSGFYIHHGPVSYLKSTFEKVWDAVPGDLENACRHRFRHPSDINQWIMEYWQYCTGCFSPRSPGFSNVFEGVSEEQKAVRSIAKGQFRAVCLNDAQDLSAEDLVLTRERFEGAFRNILSSKSSYERG